MSDNHSSSGHGHPQSYYTRIYYILLALLVVSIVGPMIGNVTILLITAFGIAIVKALMVGAYFMHLNIEKKYIWYLLIVGVLVLAVLFVGLAPDVLKTHGPNWKLTHEPVAAPHVQAHH